KFVPTHWNHLPTLVRDIRELARGQGNPPRMRIDRRRSPRIARRLGLVHRHSRSGSKTRRSILAVCPQFSQMTGIYGVVRPLGVTNEAGTPTLQVVFWQ